MSKWQRKEIILAAMAEKGTPDNIGFNLTFKQPINEKKESEKNERILSHTNLCESKFIKRGKYNREKKKKTGMLMKVSDSKIIEKWISYHII